MCNQFEVPDTSYQLIVRPRLYKLYSQNLMASSLFLNEFTESAFTTSVGILFQSLIYNSLAEEMRPNIQPGSIFNKIIHMSPSHIFFDLKKMCIVYMSDAFDQFNSFNKISGQELYNLFWIVVPSMLALCLNPSIISVSLLDLFFSLGHHACTQYSCLGCTRALYNFIMLFLFFHFIFISIMPKI